MKRFLKYLAMLIFAFAVLPSAITLLYKNHNTVQNGKILEQNKQPTEEVKISKQEKVKVYNPEVEIIEDIGIEEYIKGVVAAEMPALFEEEALKAQAIAARTYALKRMEEDSNISEEDIGQAYLSKEELKKQWGNNYNTYWNKISKAVNETKGLVMTYDDEMIDAVFHSTSAGYTESSENVWSKALPYLKAVDSHQDENAPGFITRLDFKPKEVISKLQSIYNDILFTNAPLIQQLQIVERSEAGYILQIQVGNKMLTGKQVREALNLKSSNFTINQKGEDIVFTTRGYGHGAGMSQYGANYMAQEGKSYDEILKHYYQGIKITKYNE